MYVVYILQSEKNGKRYFGHTMDIGNRLIRHNRGDVQATRLGRPWKILYTEFAQSRSEAYQREVELKSYKGGVQLRVLLQGHNETN